MIGLSKDNDDLMIFIFYCCIITFIMLSVFAIGAISFSDNLIDWIDKHWEVIRASAKTYSMSDFKQHVASELVSLGAMALTLDLSLFIMISTILIMHGFEKIMISLFPLTNLLFIVFSSALIMIAFYSNQHTYYTSALPVWANYVLVCIALFILVVAVFGYYSVTKGHFTFIMIYILVLTLSSFVCLVTGLGMIIKTSSIKEAVSKEWPYIEDRLRKAGYDISESTFANFLEVNLKFAGLFVIVFCLFLVVGLIPAIYLSFAKKRNSHTLDNKLNSTPYRFNSDSPREGVSGGMSGFGKHHRRGNRNNHMSSQDSGT